jgi:hypothetical protein
MSAPNVAFTEVVSIVFDNPKCRRLERLLGRLTELLAPESKPFQLGMKHDGDKSDRDLS